MLLRKLAQSGSLRFGMTARSVFQRIDNRLRKAGLVSNKEDYGPLTVSGGSCPEQEVRAIWTSKPMPTFCQDA